MDENLKISIETQKKFEFYFLALVFTILGLSIQTSQFSTRIQTVFEIGAWLAFLASGLAGLSRMEWIPIAYKHYSERAKEKLHSIEAKTGRPFINGTGQQLSKEEIANYAQKADERITERTKIMNKIETDVKIKYRIHKWGFVAGLVLLVISRAVGLCYSSAGPVALGK